MATKKAVKNKSKARSKCVSIVGEKHPVVKHFRLVHHKHTGKLIHHQHTSHAMLAVLLLLVGIIMFNTDGAVNASGTVTKSGTVSVGLVVMGPPPTVGAVITSPQNNDIFTDKSSITVSGTCPKENFVVIKNNNSLAGSSICDSSDKFSLDIQISVGTNVISAQNYDNLNQAGPATPDVTIISKKTEVVNPTKPSEPTPEPTPEPNLPENPSIVPGATAAAVTCENYDPNLDLPTGGEPKVSIICIPRLFLPEIQQTLGFVVWGGTPPYEISIDWGENIVASRKINVERPGYQTTKFTYYSPGIREINFHLEDKLGQTTIVQTAVQVSGQVVTPPAGTTGKTYDQDPNVVIVTGNITVDRLIGTSWFKTPVPLYLMAVAITLGFWGGDIFDRKFGAKKLKPKCS